MKINSDLIYRHSVNNVMRPTQHVFEMYSKNGADILGTLVCHKSKIKARPDYDGDVLIIDFIEAKTRKQGLGTRILNFAKTFSETLGCKGFLSLKADTSFTPDEIPHIFYRKFGFTTLDKKTDKKLDKFIKKGQNATDKDFPSILMHYPPKP